MKSRTRPHPRPTVQAVAEHSQPLSPCAAAAGEAAFTKAKHRLALFVVIGAALLGGLGTLLLLIPPALAEASAAAAPLDPGIVQWGYLAAALATGMSSLGAAYAVGNVGSAAVGALAEKPELLGRLLILVGLAEGIAIYGLIISILIFRNIS
jgi:V/A-type H+-transporting ATPase subunit K